MGTPPDMTHSITRDEQLTFLRNKIKLLKSQLKEAKLTGLTYHLLMSEVSAMERMLNETISEPRDLTTLRDLIGG